MKRFRISWVVRLFLFGVFCVLCIVNLAAPQGVSQASRGYGYGAVYTTNTSASPSLPANATIPNSATIPNDDCVLNDILPWTPPGFSLCAALQKIFSSYVLQPIQSSVQSFAQQSNGFLWTTPAIYDGNTNNNITDIWKIVLWIVDGLVALAVIINGVKLVAQQQSLTSALNYANALDAVPRVLFALLAAHFSLSFFQILVTGNNALTDIFAGDHQLIGLIDSNTASSFLQFLELFWGIMALLLIIQSIVRIGGLYILLVTSPAWMFAWGVAETQPLARAATTAAIGLTFMQALQLLVVDVGGHLVATLVLGTSPQYQVINVLSGIAVLYIALKIPGWISRWVFQSSTDVSSALKSAAAWAASMIGA